VPPSEFELALAKLDAELKRLEAEYNMYFAGRLPKPPWETRSRVQALIKQYDRRPILNTGERFRFGTLQSRYQALLDLWDRGLRAREEGRSGPFMQRRTAVPTEADTSERRVVHTASFRDPLQETDSLHKLYESLVDARRSVGEDAVPFHKFAQLVTSQVTKLKASGNQEVAFRVAVKDGKVNFTARGVKKSDER
jgi:hypothetical protein